MRNIYKIVISSLLILVLVISCSIYYYNNFYFNINSLTKIYLFHNNTIPFREKDTVYMSYRSNDPKIKHFYKKQIRAKKRGGITEKVPKKNYTIELHKNFPLAGLPSDDDWILAGSFIEKSFLRHKLSFDLYRLFNPANKSPKCKFIELYLDNNYNGLYILMERMDCKRLGINKKDSSACLFKEPPVFVDPAIYISSNPYKENDEYHQKYPNCYKINVSYKINDLREFIAYSDDSVFINNISSYFDLNEIIDWHILLLITGNGDGVIKGFYLYQTSGSDFYRLAIWDYNNSFGRNARGGLLQPGIIKFQRNLLITRLLELNAQNYKKRLKERFIYLSKSKILTSENILSMIEKDYKLMNSYASKDEMKWYTDVSNYSDTTCFKSEVNYIKQWIPQQLDIVNDYIQDL